MELSYKIRKRNVIFRPLYDSLYENKNSKTLLHINKTYPLLSYPKVSFVYYLKFKRSSSDKPYTTENVIFPPSYDPRG